ncbi:MAG TPA: helix-hairpin-helix domain-containing protein [Deltaproteobacteria bacterium]|jgi:competence ComEA-like helix-hairpin-helix protein|nr:helix-hairpin-helix domain-containing protein [Deltaproteobacteria bacterium]HPX50747.1 helix-hairpin-helix domain-containing protein [Deltaproteobacteria bacterium]HQA71994.1 helix-hairpin-helix domain-containing protein [Deltaproteobacteria bacterium]
MNIIARFSGVILIVCLALAGVVSCTGTKETQVGGTSGEETAPGGVYEEPIPGAVVEPVNINTATVAELMVIPGMDQATAQNIVQYREVNGPFDSVDSLLNVSGVDEQRLDSIRDWVTVEEPGVIEEGTPIPQEEPSAPEQDSGDVFQNGEY